MLEALNNRRRLGMETHKKYNFNDNEQITDTEVVHRQYKFDEVLSPNLLVILIKKPISHLLMPVIGINSIVIY